MARPQTPGEPGARPPLLRHPPLDESVTVGRRLATAGTSDVVDAHLTVVAERLGTFIVTTDPLDMSKLEARFEAY